jgi:predicted RNase H-like nuclease (RuvC/YqgF family)
MYAIAAGFGVLGSGLKEVGSGIVKAIRRKAADDKQAREEAREENAEREQWSAIQTVRQGQADHERQDAQIHTELRTKVDRMHEDLKELKSDVKTLLRRSTGDVPRRSG